MIERTVTLSRPDGETMKGYYARAADDVLPGVLIIHEGWGLNDQIRSVAQRFAAVGYAALAIDLFSNRNQALCLLRALTDLVRKPLDNEGIRDLQAAIDWFQRQTGIDARRIGVIGFCLGGGYALSLACVDNDVRAVSAFYGMMPKDDTFKDACAVAASYGGRDPQLKGVPVRLEHALNRFNVPHDVKVYPGAMHSFFNDQSRFYDRDAAFDSWQRTLAFFDKHLVARHDG